MGREVARQALDRYGHRREPAQGRGDAARGCGQAPSRAGGTSTIPRRAAPTCRCSIRRCGVRGGGNLPSRSAATCARSRRCSSGWSTRSSRWSATIRGCATSRPATGSLFQVTSEAVLIVDAASHKVMEANPAAAQLLGETVKRLVGRVFPEGFDPGHARPMPRAAGRRAGHRPRRRMSARGWPTGSASSLVRPRCSVRRTPRCSWSGCCRSDGDAGAVVAARGQVDGCSSWSRARPDGFVVTEPGRADPDRQRRLPRSGPAGRPRSRRSANRWSAGSGGPASTSTC